MKIAEGNDKLGKNCFVVSRPVGDTCPSSCAFLNNGCYAEATERQYNNARVAGFANVITERGRIRSMILEVIRKGKSIRWHERGDWFNNGVLDVEYVENVKWACESILSEGKELPLMWFYTHIYDSRLADMSKYMAVYASVHNADDMNQARKAGFNRFAWCDSDKNVAPKRPKSKVKADAWRNELPKLTIIQGEKFVTCPEIKRGRNNVTCTGNKNSIACNMCVKGTANVLFPCH